MGYGDLKTSGLLLTINKRHLLAVFVTGLEFYKVKNWCFLSPNFVHKFSI